MQREQRRTRASIRNPLLDEVASIDAVITRTSSHTVVPHLLSASTHIYTFRSSLEEVRDDNHHPSHRQVRALRQEQPEAFSVLYIAGMLRSGSTLLAASLASAPGAVTIGESSMLWNAIEKGKLCTCGQQVTDCPFWHPILSGLFANGSIDPNLCP